MRNQCQCKLPYVYLGTDTCNICNYQQTRFSTEQKPKTTFKKFKGDEYKPGDIVEVIGNSYACLVEIQSYISKGWYRVKLPNGGFHETQILGDIVFLKIQDMQKDEKHVLAAVLSDADYIQELEGLVCFLAGCYEKAKETYFDNHMATCSVANPNRRDLTEAEQNEWQRFPMIQGSILQHIVSDIAKANKPEPKDIQGLLRRLKAFPLTP